MWYNINYRKLVVLLLPTFLRKGKMIAFLQCLIKPVDQVYSLWKTKRERDCYSIDHNGQRCYLRKVLNDELDPVERRIYIDDGNAFKRDYIYTHDEKKTVFLDKIFINSNLDYLGTGVDFIVCCPAEIVNKQIHKLNYLINFYRLAGKRYKIQEI